MADNFTNHVFKTGVASLCQAIGWNSAHQGTIDVLSDIWRRQFLEVAKLSTNYAMHYGRTEVTLDDTALAFNDLRISVGELEEYASNFDPVPLPYRIPNFPIPKESNLNLLKPGSEEMLTRPEHVHEYMPTWNPLTTEEIRKARDAAKSFSDSESEVSSSKNADKPTRPESTPRSSNNSASASPTKAKLSNPDRAPSSQETNKVSEDKTLLGMKREETPSTQAAPESPSSTPPQSTNNAPKPGKRLESPFENAAIKRVRLMLEEEGYILRPVTSAMMTTSGFLTSSVEGRLPDTRPPPNLDFFEPAPAEKKKKIPTMKRIIEGIKKIDKEKENQGVKEGDDEDVEEYQDNLFSNPDRIQKLIKIKEPEETPSREKLKAIRKVSRAFKSIEKAHREEQKLVKRKGSKAEKRKRKEREEESESEQESIEEFSDLDKTPEEINVEEEEVPRKGKKAKIPKLTIEKLKDKKKSKSPKVEEPVAVSEEPEADTAIPSARASDQTTMAGKRGRPKKLEFSDMPASLFEDQLMPADDDYTKVRRRSKRNSIDQRDMEMLVPEISINVSKQSRAPQAPPLDFNLGMGRIPTQPGLIPAAFNTQSLLQQQNQFSIVPSISITPSTPEVSLTPLTPRDLATPTSSLGLSSNIGSSITITRINMADRLQKQAQPSTSSLTSPLSISITKESHSKTVPSPNVSRQKQGNTGITITPIMMKQEVEVQHEHHSIPDFSLTEGISPRERHRSGSANEEFRTKEQRKKDREKRKELKKERKKEKKLKEKEKGKVEKIKLSSDGTGSGFSVERKEKKDKDKKKNRDSLSGVLSRPEATVPKITLKIHSNTSTPVDSPRGMDRETPPPTRKITIKPIEENVKRRTPSPEFARFSAAIPTIKPPKLSKIPKVQSTPTTPLPATDVVSFPAPGTSSGTKKGKKTPKGKGKATQSGLVTETVGFYVDEEGNKVWICPACGRVDDGSPMIGCDTCDDWYHFTCMGIEAEPDESEPWYCAKCSIKKARPSDQKRRVLKL